METADSNIVERKTEPIKENKMKTLSRRLKPSPRALGMRLVGLGLMDSFS